MPNLNFVLPHWLYWGALIVFPLVAMYLVERQRRRGAPQQASLFVAYLFLVTGGLWGLHRFYLRSLWGFIYLPLFLAVLFVNDGIRDRLEDLSRTRAAYESAHSQTNRIRPNQGVTLSPEAEQRLKAAETREAEARSAFAAADDALGRERLISQIIAGVIALLLLIDAALLPGLLRRVREREALNPVTVGVDPPVADIPPAGTQEDPTLGLHTRFTDAIEWVNIKVGEFVAYWAVLAVFAYYYEVLGRYVFNSPTNWVHESMFLMFGMQYMLSGAYAYREDQHVRVDVFYTHFSRRGKAIADIITSVFFFIFILTMLWTGWRFASDAINNAELSFTEWQVQYWPVKLTIPIGAALLALQGLSRLIKDINIVIQEGRA
jgi:TRAP-type mannitol/chloroaromatic compound transport system permease small subunit